MNASYFHPQVNLIVFKPVVVLHLYFSFVIRSRSGFGALITGAERYDELILAHHKYVFVVKVGLVFVGAAIIFNGCFWNKKRRKQVSDVQDKPLTVSLLAYKCQEKQENANEGRSIQ